VLHKGGGGGVFHRVECSRAAFTFYSSWSYHIISCANVWPLHFHSQPYSPGIDDFVHAFHGPVAAHNHAATSFTVQQE
jgi:hypothetical protein